MTARSSLTLPQPRQSPRGGIRRLAERLRARLPLRLLRFAPHALILGLVLLVGLLARTWEFGSLPPGLAQDEASSGVDAFSLHRFGVDANGISYPTHMISFGSGTSPLYTYVLIPFVALGGLSPLTVRLPMLVTGMLTLPLVYLIGKRVGGHQYGVLSAFLLAISPWHILMSRWGLDANILPFVFSAAFLFLLRSLVDTRWLLPSMLLMALCLYAYATAYAAVPLFLAGALAVLLGAKKLPVVSVIRGVILFAALCVPILLFVWINVASLPDIRLGPITIPRMPTTARFLTTAVVFNSDFLPSLPSRLLGLLQFLWFGVSEYPLDSFEPYGYFYPFALPFAIAGAAVLALSGESERWAERMLLLMWLAAGLALGVLQSVDTTRLNLLFIPLVFCVAATLLWVGRRSAILFSALLLMLAVGFLSFTRDYHGDAYRAEAARAGFAGLLPAIDYASRAATNRICITDTVNMPYIHVLFSQHLDPADYLPSVRYAPFKHEFRLVIMLNRYRFGMTHCPHDERIVYILYDETPPHLDAGYSSQVFEQYTVYVPEIAAP